MSRLNKSWERTREDTHSPEGVETIRRNVRDGLTRFYVGIAQSMWRYDFGSDRFDDMRLMSRDLVPERFLTDNGECVWFSDERTGQIHCLPFTNGDSGINIYGQVTSWYPIPIGWDDSLKGRNADIDRIRFTPHDLTDSVIMRNDRFGGSDRAFIESMVAELVDNHMTMNQLQLIAKCPFIFNVTEENLMSAKNFFLSLCTDKPVIFTNAMGEKTTPDVVDMASKIDPALFELFDRFECQILTYLGFPCVPITKRAQQTVSEVQSNDSKLYARRMEKFEQRRNACRRISKMFGVSIEVHSIIDEDIAAIALKDSEGSDSDADVREAAG